MMYSKETLWCTGCGTEILWSPFLVKDQKFCCQECAQGLSCKCSETMDWQNEHRDTEAALPTTYSE